MSAPVRLPTDFLPAERADSEQLQRAFDRIVAAPLFKKTLDLVPDPVLILNKERQIVYCNKAALMMLSLENFEAALGLRPGEAMRCIHSDERPGGCGTTEFCKECGTPKAILAAQAGKEGRTECRIATKSGDALNLRIWASDFQIGGDTFTAFAVTDTSHEMRRRALEQIFFHDILNTASGLQGLTAIFKESSPQEKEEFQELLFGLSNKLIDEINAQRQLSAAENDELKPVLESVNAKALVEDVAASYRHHEVGRGRTLQVDAGTVPKSLVSDKTLLRRVIGNMTKNALEATRAGETVTLGCDEKGGSLEFWVHNSAVIPRSVQLQLFQRSFSTRGSGRGLGTYSMKLLTERYLRGKMAFTSEEGAGTRFIARLPLAA